MKEQRIKESFLNIPNAITIFRSLAVFVIMILLWLLQKTPGIETNFRLSIITSIIYFLVAISDSFDGLIARRWNMVTETGKLLDPIADKALVVATGVMLIPLGRVPAWVIALIIIREIIITGIRGIASAQGMVISASPLGKAKTFIQNTSFVFLTLHHPIFGVPIQFIGTIILYIALILTWVSGLDYIIKYRKRRKEILLTSPPK